MDDTEALRRQLKIKGLEVELYKTAIKYAIHALKFYGDIKYSSTWGVPCETQWIAEDTLEVLERLIK